MTLLPLYFFVLFVIIIFEALYFVRIKKQKDVSGGKFFLIPLILLFLAGAVTAYWQVSKKQKISSSQKITFTPTVNQTSTPTPTSIIITLSPKISPTETERKGGPTTPTPSQVAISSPSAAITQGFDQIIVPKLPIAGNIATTAIYILGASIPLFIGLIL